MSTPTIWDKIIQLNSMWFDILNEQINLDGSLIIGEVYSQFFSPAVKEIE